MTNTIPAVKTQRFDTIIIGAGASGLMCAIEAGKRGRKVLVLDHTNKVGKKILMSGGGRCNFTNYTIDSEQYLSSNPHFCKSALSRYSQWDFLVLINRYQIAFHEREHGQLFCDDSAKEIVDLLLTEIKHAKVVIKLNANVRNITKDSDLFVIHTSEYVLYSHSLTIATGGLSIPKIGASPFGYKIAQQFNIPVIPTRAGLVPFTLQPKDKEKWSKLSGIAVKCSVNNRGQHFKENLLFTHRGVSGPAILQISSYWQTGETIQINLLPDMDLNAILRQQRQQAKTIKVKKFLNDYLPKRLLSTFLSVSVLETVLANLSDKKIQLITQTLQSWKLQPNATEGYRTAEVTLGGIDCHAISSKTFESHHVKGLYFIGEVLDVTGQLGGYNFQWAWSSGWCAGQYV
ncbi:MAG: NAD(P)/FAD-dependent oxidoreductase [Methylococcales bacterium]|nr:NAD(P)/FAD-dependent oxidoreductase [Methylococcales bacterium]